MSQLITFHVICFLFLSKTTNDVISVWDIYYSYDIETVGKRGFYLVF